MDVGGIWCRLLLDLVTFILLAVLSPSARDLHCAGCVINTSKYKTFFGEAPFVRA